RLGLSDAEVGDVLLEVQSYIDETGEPPEEAFGTPEDYARSRAIDPQPYPSIRESPRRKLQLVLLVIGGILLIGSPVAESVFFEDIPRFLPAFGILVGFAIMYVSLRLTPLSARKGPVDPVSGRSLMPDNSRKVLAFSILIFLVLGIISIVVNLILN